MDLQAAADVYGRDDPHQRKRHLDPVEHSTEKKENHMNNVKSKVALVRCFSYQQEEVEQALAKGLALLGGFSNIFSATAYPGRGTAWAVPSPGML